MMRLRWLVLGLLLLVVAGCSSRSRLVQAPLADDPMQVSIHRLSNGLTVYLSPSPLAPRFSAEIVVRAGSKHDPDDATGLAHYLEHLLFKGSKQLGTLNYEAEHHFIELITQLYEQHFHETDPERRAEIYREIDRVSTNAARFAIPNELDRVFKALGGTGLNAHTWVEETVYKIDLPSNVTEQWARIESDRFANPVFRLFHTELETVYEEKNASMDNQSRLVYHTMNELLYKNHPYRRTTLGDAEHLKSPSLVTIQRYFDDYYVPSNMAIAISGDFDRREMLRTIERHFSSWEPGTPPAPKQWLEPPLDGREFAEVFYPGEEYVLIGFHTVPINHDDLPAVRMVDMILDNRTAGLINLNLVTRQEVRDAGAYPLNMNDHGAQFVYGIPKADQSLEEVEAMLLEQIDFVRRGDWDEWLLAAIVNDLRTRHAESLEDNTSRVNAMRDAFLHYKNWPDVVAEIDAYAAVTRDDVLRVARQYFGPGRGYAVVYRRDGQHSFTAIEKPPITPLQLDASRESAFARAILDTPVDPIEATPVVEGESYTLAEIAPGRQLLWTPNTINDLFQLSIIVERGSEADPMLGFINRLMERAGTERLSAEDLNREWYKLGVNFAVSIWEDEARINLSGLDSELEPALALAREVLESPAAEPRDLDELRRIVRGERDNARKDPNSLASALTLFARHGEESPLLERPSMAEIDQVTIADAFARFRSLFDYEHRIEYAGPRPAEEVASVVNELIPAPESLLAVDPPRRRTVRTPEQTEILFVHLETAQAQLRIESDAGATDPEPNYYAQLFNRYFSGGLGGLFYQEIRESRGLAYFAGSVVRPGRHHDHPALFIAALNCQPDKTAEALEAAINLIDAMPEQPERFVNATASFESVLRTDYPTFRTIPGMVTSWQRIGHPDDPRPRWIERLPQTALDDLMVYYRERVQQRPRLISIVGDRERIPLETVRQTYPDAVFREVEIDELFRD